MINTGKIVGAVVLLLLLVAGGYYVYGDSDSQSTDLLTEQTPTEEASGPSEEGEEDTRLTAATALQKLNQLQQIELSTEFFETKEFRSLKNFGITIQPQPTGRDNPFREPRVNIPLEIVQEQEPLTLPDKDTATTTSQPGTSTPPQATTTDASGTSTGPQS